MTFSGKELYGHNRDLDEIQEIVDAAKKDDATTEVKAKARVITSTPTKSNFQPGMKLR